MRPGRIRTIAIAVIQRPSDGAVLAFYGEDPNDGRRFYRPLGGGIEFGESSIDAVRRELQEEIGAEVDPVRLMGVVENIFTHRDQTGHEIVFIWECHLLDERFYAHEEILMDENGVAAIAHWVHPRQLAAQGIHFYPEELADYLRNQLSVISDQSQRPSPQSPVPSPQQ
jgi:ADP-ribose pyrophosphatase YjhB (NUDIX family)